MWDKTLVTSESIQANIAYIDSIKQTLLSFKLTPQHYVCLLVERANTEAMVAGVDPVVNTRKEMRKQLKKVNGKKKLIEWRPVRLLERAIQLLDSKQFIDVVRRLLKHELMPLRRRALNLLNSKLLRKYKPSDKVKRSRCLSP